MQSLRSVMTQATRGGKWVASRRKFSSSSVCKETNEALNEEWTSTQTKMAIRKVCAGFSLGYLLTSEKIGTKRLKKQKEKYLREEKTLQSGNWKAADM
ncbi:unnamed protein product [Microthlaspi erraticum]|uniref:Uncharacterized protein n=1 Tax=Microthlaspi erraticum TaxID=1685480 RepID=A0A6D2J435_9BRAS|nr:unnamed protein product [Microthlaspi erraticum]